MNIFGFRPFKGKFSLGNSDDIPTNNDGTLIGAIKQINTQLSGLSKQKTVDFTNIIQATVVGTSGTVYSYTATKPCVIVFTHYGNGTYSGAAWVNDVKISIAYLALGGGTSYEVDGFTPILCTGDVFKVYAGTNGCSYTVYGLKEIN